MTGSIPIAATDPSAAETPAVTDPDACAMGCWSLMQSLELLFLDGHQRQDGGAGRPT